MTLTFTDIWTSDLDDSFTLVGLVDETNKKSQQVFSEGWMCWGACVCWSRLFTYLGDAGWEEQGIHCRTKQKLVEVLVEYLVSWSDEVVRWLDCLAVNWSRASREANSSDSLK